MATWDLFWWGALGGVGAWLVAIILPLLPRLDDPPPRPKFDFLQALWATCWFLWRLGGLLLVGGIYGVLGGIAAIGLGSGSTSIAQAICMGIGGEAFVKTTAQAVSNKARQSKRNAPPTPTPAPAQRRATNPPAAEPPSGGHRPASGSPPLEHEELAPSVSAPATTEP